MPQQFIKRIEQVSRHRHLRRCLAASCWALSALLVAGLVLAVLDRGLGISDRAGRVLLTTLWIGISLSVLRRWWKAMTKTVGSPLQVSEEVEQRHPELRGVVGNAWQFARQAEGDPTAGSESLRRAVVLRAESGVQDVDWRRFVPRQPLQRAGLVFAAVFVAMASLGWFLPQAFETGLTRLLNPFSNAQWPRTHDLQFVDPPKLMATGEDLVLLLEDKRGALPEMIDMHYRTQHLGRWREETQSYATEGKLLQLQRANVQDSLQFRATGGDHWSMPWHSVEVVPPPRIEQMLITVYPPAYTELPSQSWEMTEPIYAGSELQLQGRTDQPVTQVVLESDAGQQLAARLGADKREFSLAASDWQVDHDGTYHLQLTTPAGLTVTASKPIVLDVIADSPPQVRWVEPTEDLNVLAKATVPLLIEAIDELALRSIVLAYRIEGRPGESGQSVPLWNAAENSQASTVRQQQVGYELQLELMMLSPGAVIEIHAEATDAQPATARTARALRLSVVSEAALGEQLLQLQTQVVERLVRLRNEQRELLAITGDWAAPPEWPASRWNNVLHMALFQQRQIADSLAMEQQCVINQLEELTQTIERNTLRQPETTVHIRAAQELLRHVVDEPLAAIDRALTTLARDSTVLVKHETAHPAVADLARIQAEVADQLGRAIELLMPGSVMGRLQQELAEIAVDQQTLADRCRKEVAPSLLQSEQISAEQQIELENALRRQRDLNQRFSKFVLNIAQAAERLSEDPSVAARLVDTATLAQELGTQNTMETAAEQLSRRRVGRTITLQSQILEDFVILRQRLAGQDAAGATERLAQLRSTERALAILRQQVAELESRLQELSSNENQSELRQLRQQREKLARQAEAITRQLERLRLPRAAEATGIATSQLQSQQFNGETTKQARQQLDQAQRELTTERRSQQVAMARLEMMQLDAQLGPLLKRQQSIQQEAARLRELAEPPGKENGDGQWQRATQLSSRQAEVRSDVEAAAENLSALPVFAHLLNASGQTMRGVEQRMSQADLGKDTQKLLEQAVRQLIHLTEALQEEKKNLSRTGQGGVGQGDSGDTPEEQSLQLVLGQLSLLRSLQLELHEKTLNVVREQSANETSQYSVGELAQEQQALTRLARELRVEPSNPAPEGPFPDLRNDEDLLPKEEQP